MRKVLPGIFLVLAGWFVGGCSALVQKPTVTLQSAAIDHASPAGVVVNFDLNVSNPNGFAIPVTRAQYKLALGGVTVIDDKATPEGSVPANGALPVRLPVTLTFESLLNAGQAIRQSGGNVPYDFDGSLDFGSPKYLGTATLSAPVHFTGTLPLRQILKDPQVLLQSPAARKLAEQVLGGLFDR
jgi:LEA14-like dessication related protein